MTQIGNKRSRNFLPTIEFKGFFSEAKLGTGERLSELCRRAKPKSKKWQSHSNSCISGN